MAQTRDIGAKLPWTHRLLAICACFAVLVCLTVFAWPKTAQSSERVGPFRIGEKLSYTISFEKFRNVGYFETYVASRGKLGGKDVVEIHGRAKTFDLVSAAFAMLDETRTVFADPATGLPLYITRTQNAAAVPQEVSTSFLNTPATGLDLLTFLYKLREGHGSGSFSVMEGNEASILTAEISDTEKVKTDAGEFNTQVSTITGPFLDARGIKRLTVDLSLDGDDVPVVIRIRTKEGEYRLELRSVTIDAPNTPPVQTPTPIVSRTPKPPASPRPQPSPAPYLDNQPLLPELVFLLGEKLEYRVTNAGVPAAVLTLEARERKFIQDRDTLVLAATITGTESGNHIFALGDSIVARVDPITLAPFQTETKFGGSLRTLNNNVMFDPKTGAITVNAGTPVDAPIGTHSILSLLYAIRSFNLAPSRDRENPVNDTRVAVFWGDRAHIFTLRPGDTQMLTIDGKSIPAQLITIAAGDPQLDPLGLKVWLTTDGARVPVRFTAGTYQADLTSSTISIPR